MHVDSLQIDLCPVVFFFQCLTAGSGSGLAIVEIADIIGLVEEPSANDVDLHEAFRLMYVVWQQMGSITSPPVTLDQLVYQCLHNVAILSHNVTELVTDESVGVRLVMHCKADIHGTIQIGHGFSLAQGRAGHGVGLIHHAVIIGTGWGDLGSVVDSLPAGTAAADQFVLVLYCIFHL